jgi:hypothetical protein
MTLNEFKMLVKVAFEILSIGEIDTIQETFQANFRIESRWQADDDFNGIYNPALHWNPLLYVDNVVKSNQEVRYEVHFDSLKNHTFITEIREVEGCKSEKTPALLIKN